MLTDNDIDGDVLLKLTDRDLNEGLAIKSLGKRKKLLEVKWDAFSFSARGVNVCLHGGLLGNKETETTFS